MAARGTLQTRHHHIITLHHFPQTLHNASFIKGSYSTKTKLASMAHKQPSLLFSATTSEMEFNIYAMKAIIQEKYHSGKNLHLIRHTKLLKSIQLTCILVVDGTEGNIERLAAPHHVRRHVGGLVSLHWLSKCCHHSLHKPAGINCVGLIKELKRC